MDIPAFAAGILRTLETAGYEAYCVGGCVRDALLGRMPEDWDIATAARPEETLALFGPDALPTGLRHGTVTIRRPGGSAEVTTFRRDGDYTDHRRPESVTFTASLEEDLARRDFTVNAMAFSLRGELRDPFGGREDLEERRIRCVGEPARRFGEDALRILRGLRFAAVLDFTIEPETAAALSSARGDLAAIAPERILTELRKLLLSPRPSAVLRTFPEVFGVFWPELAPMVGFGQRNPHHCYDLWEHTLHALDAVPPEESLRFAALLHDVGKPDCFSLDEDGVGHFYGHAARSAALADAMLVRLRAGNALREEVTELIRRHDTPLPGCPEATLRRLLRRLGEERLRRLIALQRADNLAQAPAYRDRTRALNEVLTRLDDILFRDACFSLRQLAVNGRDLLALGFRGPAIGTALDHLLNQVVEGRLPNERRALLAALRAGNGPQEDAGKPEDAGEDR